MNLHPIQMEAAQQYPRSFFIVIKTGHLPHLHRLNRGRWGGEGGLQLTLSSPEGLNRGFMVHVDNFIINWNEMLNTF